MLREWIKKSPHLHSIKQGPLNPQYFGTINPDPDPEKYVDADPKKHVNPRNKISN